ncbi:MAG: hypothetical protein ACE5GU_13495 [Candidatus Scalinduaceae bacterium]
MSEHSKQSNQSTNSKDAKNDNSKGHQDPFPPRLSHLQRGVQIFAYVLAFIALICLIVQFCKQADTSCVCCTYITLAILLTILLVDRIIRNKITVHKARLVDHSLVEAMIVDAQTVEHRIIINKSKKPDNYEKKVEDIKKEVNRLEELGNRSWTEYQVLSLNQMLVDFYKVDDLIANTQLSLAELEEYAEGNAYRYDRDKYYNIKERIDEAIEKIKKIDKAKSDDNDSKINREVARDEASEQLRAELRTLLEHVAYYNNSWTTGSELVRALTVLGVVSIPILLAMGLLPILHPGGKSYLGILNWGLLGICGAITSALQNLRNTNLVEVGNTEGKKELRNAILGAALGLVAGVLAYSMFRGGLFQSGLIVPELESGETSDVFLSIIWGVVSGFSFEKIFDRVRSVTVGEN